MKAVARISLSKIERRILINQYQILEKLDPDEGDYYQKVVSILEHGYEFEYRKLFERIFDPMSEEESVEVIHILGMYEAIKDSYDALPDKSGIEDWRVRFIGFDGNHEGTQLGYLYFMVEKDEKFSHVVDKNKLNSHMPRLGYYRAMLNRYKEKGEIRHPGRMDKETLEYVLGIEPEKPSFIVGGSVPS
jgi:uncharacterized protein